VMIVRGEGGKKKRTRGFKSSKRNYQRRRGSGKGKVNLGEEEE